MSDARRERSAEEREAARRERELRRGGRAGETTAPPQAAPPAVAPPTVAPPPVRPPPPLAPAPPAAAEPTRTSFRIGEESARADEDQPAPPPLPLDAEAPSGTKRVRRPAGHLRLPARRQRTPKPPGGHPLRRRVVAVIVLILAAALAWFLVELFQPFQGSPHGHVTVKIPAHSTSGEIGDLLAKERVISSSFFFELRATLAGERDDLRSGTYHLQLGMGYGDVLKALTTAPKAAKVTELTISEGRTRREIDALLRSQGVKGSYLAETRRSKLLDLRKYGAPRSTSMLEGFMFPSTYDLTEPISIPVLVDKQLIAFKHEFDKINFNYAQRRRLTPYDVLIVASMVEAEASTEHDRPLVASVIYNRLRDGMPLQIDATTRYATGNYSSPLTNAQLNSHSPYNTRIHKGLPPTPIDNPGLASIQAAAHPARTNYLYFVVKPCGNGEQVFTGSYQQFLKDAAKYQAARSKRGGRSPAHC
jgi:uncharacterized YceG family protein